MKEFHFEYLLRAHVGLSVEKLVRRRNGQKKSKRKGFGAMKQFIHIAEILPFSWYIWLVAHRNTAASSEKMLLRKVRFCFF